MLRFFDIGPNQYCIKPSEDFLSHSIYNFIPGFGIVNHVVDIPAGKFDVDDAINAFVEEWNCHGRATKGHLRQASVG